MFKNYLTSAFNNLLKSKLFSFINIAGLSIGLVACILIALYVQDETSYDTHWENADRIYRLNTSIDPGSGMMRSPGSSGLAIPALVRDYPELIEHGSRLMIFEREVEYEDQHVEEMVAAVDPDVIDIFDFEEIVGDLSEALNDPSTIALEENFAARIFVGQAELGALLDVSLNGVTRTYRVGAIYRLSPGNTVLDLPAMILLDESVLPPFMFSWGNMFFTSYLQLSETADIENMTDLLPDFRDRNVDLSVMSIPPDQVAARYAMDIQNIADIHLNSPFDTSRAGGNQTVVLAFSMISALVLLIGCINFTILSTARATRRAREVAMRKVAGASRLQLVLQYLGESFLVVLPAMVAALTLVELALPVFEGMVGKSLEVQYTEAGTSIGLLVLLLVVSVVGGLYPAFVLSGFRPASSLKSSRFTETQGATRLRNSLVVFQFAISIALMIATAVVYLQVQYVAGRDPGFNPENLLVVDDLSLRAEVNARTPVLKEQISNLPGVTSVSLSSTQPTQTTLYAMNFTNYTVPGVAGESTGIATLGIDADYFSTYQIELLAGREFSADRESSTQIYTADAERVDRGSPESVIINESAVKALGFSSAEAAVGRRLNSNGLGLNIVGVAADTNFFSLNAPPRAEVYVYGFGSQLMDVLTVRYTGSPQDVLASVRGDWEQVMGDAEFTTSIVTQNMEQEFARERTEASMLISFALLAISIACLGLFGSAAYTVERRTKEIGIRKVVGAEVREIVSLLLWQFSKPVLLANVISWPVAIWAMLIWLQRFPYQIETLLLIPMCVLAGFTALFIAWVTVGGTAAKAASQKPVLALRYE